MTMMRVTEALELIFRGLIMELHMPNSGDGLTLVSAMRHFQPTVLTIILRAFVRNWIC
jgi:hypothetical protein